jgi:hypothetical protein
LSPWSKIGRSIAERCAQYELANCLECGLTFTCNPDYSSRRYLSAYGLDGGLASLSLRGIHGFWRIRWEPGFSNVRRRSRDYTSGGLLLAPDPQVRVALRQPLPSREDERPWG